MAVMILALADGATAMSDMAMLLDGRRLQVKGRILGNSQIVTWERSPAPWYNETTLGLPPSHEEAQVLRRSEGNETWAGWS